jgi:muramoyltetrapeptide carboxypeptidase
MKEFMPLLKAGDEIRIIATARKINPEDLSQSISFLEKKGFKVSLGKNLYKTDHQFAGNDEERFEDLQNALDDTSLKAIWMARGGYGTHRIIEKISFESFKKHPKWIVGYSDVTVLHCALNRKNFSSLHATMPINFKDQQIDSFEKMIDVLEGAYPEYEIDPHYLNQKGHAEGRLLGGNLSILYSLSGSPFLPDFDNAILFIEDLDEYLYHIDRMMMNLKLSGLLKGLKAIIVGGMSDMNDNAIPFGRTAIEIISTYAKELAIPICFGFPAGHQFQNYPIVLGEVVQLSIDDKRVKLSY